MLLLFIIITFMGFMNVIFFDEQINFKIDLILLT